MLGKRVGGTLFNNSYGLPYQEPAQKKLNLTVVVSLMGEMVGMAEEGREGVVDYLCCLPTSRRSILYFVVGRL